MTKRDKPQIYVTYHAVQRYCERVLGIKPPVWDKTAPEDYRAREMCRRANRTLRSIRYEISGSPCVRYAQEVGLPQAFMPNCIVKIDVNTGVIATIVGRNRKTLRKNTRKARTISKNRHQRKSS